MNELKPLEYSIYCNIPLDAMLNDVRPGRYGQKFGRVRDVCRQYGIKCIQREKCVEFTAPKLRLQLFMEKMHFAGIRYGKKSL